MIFCFIFITIVSFNSFASPETVSNVGSYDNSNIFAKILRKEAPADIIYEDEYVLAFKDIHPIKAVHILVIPKGKYRSILDFSEKASDVEITALIRALGKIAKQLNIAQDGFSVMSNSGHNGGQTVPHLHFHLLGGEQVSWEKALRNIKGNLN